MYYLILSILLSLFSQQLSASEGSKSTEEKQEASKSLLWEDFRSPYTTDAIYFLSTGMLLSTIIGNDDRNLDTQLKNQAEFDPPLKDYGYIGETLGWGYLNGLYIIGLGLHAYATDRKKSYERAEIMLSSSTMTLLATSLLKVSVKRGRPAFPEKEDSFPSGHASMSFNFASVVTAEHGPWWGVPAYALATAISYSRVNDGWHWLTDIMAGATIGLSYGWGVYFNRRKKVRNFWFSVIPGETPNSFGLAGVYKF